MSVNLRGAFFLAQEVSRACSPCRPIPTARSSSSPPSAPPWSRPTGRNTASPRRARPMMAQALPRRLAPREHRRLRHPPGIVATPMTAPVADSLRSAHRRRPRARAALGHARRHRADHPPLVRGDFAFATGAVIPSMAGFPSTGSEGASWPRLDLIVIGAGSAGLRTGGAPPRARATVCLLEGPAAARNPLYHLPAASRRMDQGHRAWGWETVPQPPHAGPAVVRTTPKPRSWVAFPRSTRRIYTRGNALDYASGGAEAATAGG